MKRTVTARLYALDHADTRHQLTATSAVDLAQQVQAITANKTASGLARAAWGDDDADLRAAGVRLVSVGAVVRETWRSLPPLKGQPHGGQEEAATTATAQGLPEVQPTITPQADGA